MPLLPLTWAQVGEPSPTLPLSMGTWNLLADGLTSDFTHIAPDALAWPLRGPQILAELTSLHLDICCLQELNHPETLRELSATHALLFAPKLLSPALAGGAPGCGTALLLRRERLEVVAVDVVYFAAPAGGLSNQVAIVATVRDRASGRQLVVSSAHLKAGAGAANEALRLSQVQQLAAHVRGARMHAEAATGRPVPCVCGGDFNTAPGEAPYGALLTALPGAASAFNALPAAAAGSVGVGEYAAGEPRFTTWKFRGHGRAGGEEKKVTEDYVFYTAGSGLRLAGRKRLPEEAELGQYGLPSAACPSDHLPLAAQFAWEE